MKIEGLEGFRLKNVEELTDEEKADRTKKEKYLEKCGVNVYMYKNEFGCPPKHPDGIHCYAVDSYTAYKLVMFEDKEIPDDLKERLLYYKKIMSEAEGENTNE